VARNERAGTTPAKKTERKPVEVGQVSVGVSSEPLAASQRRSKLDSNPVALAVRDAETGKTYDIKTETGKEDAVVTILRRAGQRFGKGVKIRQFNGLVKFEVGPRQSRPRKAKAAE
jgi:hypothetical protein